MLRGRAVETSAIAELIQAAHAGESNVLVLRGEPGIGKSALIDYARSKAGTAVVLASRATEVESEIPYVHLADLLRPVADKIAAIPQRQATALEGVLALGPATAADRLAVAAATLTLLDAVATDRPVLVLVDDVQWVDKFSFEAIAFAARRLRAEGVLVLLAVREGEDVPGLEHFGQLRLTGLDDQSARELIASTGQVVGDAVIARLVAESGGNPLALLELPTLLDPRQLSAWTQGLDPLPIGAVIERAFARSLQGLPTETRDALLVLAILGSVPPEIVERALDVAGLPAAALDPAVAAGLVRDDGPRLAFRHPLVRAALYHTARHTQRRRAHSWAAEALDGAAVPNILERRAWHLVAAGSGPDESLAAVLATRAETEFAQRNFALAGTLFQRSADVTPKGQEASARLFRAAEAVRLAGAIPEARALLERAATDATGSLAAQIAFRSCRMDIWRGEAVRGRDAMLRLAAAIEAAEPQLSAAVRAEAALASIEIGEISAAVRTSARAVELLGEPEALPLAVDVVRSLALALSGAESAAEPLQRRADEVDAIDPLGNDLADQLILVAGVAHLAMEQVARAETLLERSVQHARESGAPGVLPFRLGRLSLVPFWQGRWATAYALASEALRLAADTGWVSEQPNSLSLLARIEALTGRDAACRDHAEQGARLAGELGILSYQGYALAALGMRAIANGEYEDAAQHLSMVESFASASGLIDTPLLWWSADLVEAYVQLDQQTEARAVLNRFEQTLSQECRPTSAAVAARCRALLEPDDFDTHIVAALRWHDKAQMPFERARTELLLGTTLRRRRMARQAREHLVAALTIFERLEAPAWADRARAQLGGGAPRRGDTPARFGMLTPQELQVALRVARGMSNREIAAQLFLSVKTVEFHLGNAFHKLGVKRRTQLAALFASEQDGREAPRQPAAVAR